MTCLAEVCNQASAEVGVSVLPHTVISQRERAFNLFDLFIFLWSYAASATTKRRETFQPASVKDTFLLLPVNSHSAQLK